MRIAVLCPAEIAARRFLPALKKVEGADFVGVGVSTSDERFLNQPFIPEEAGAVRRAGMGKAKAIVDQFGGHVFESYSDLITSDEIDSIYIPLPPALHYKWAKAALEAGKNVLIEKPATISFEQTNDLVETAESKGLALHENYMFVFHRQIERIDELISEGEIGSLRLIRLTFGFPKRAAADFRYKKAMGGGSLFDAGGYTIKYADRLLGETARIEAARLNYLEDYDVDAFGSITMVNAEGLTAQLSFGMDNDYKCEAEIWGSNGTIKTGRVFTAPPGFKPSLTIKHNQDLRSVELEEDDSFRKSIEHFLKCTQDNKTQTNTFNAIRRQAALVDDALSLAGQR